MGDLNAANSVSPQDIDSLDPLARPSLRESVVAAERIEHQAQSPLEKFHLPAITGEKALSDAQVVAVIPRTVLKEHMLGYHYLCGERRESQDRQEGHNGLSLLRLQLEEGCFAERDVIPTEDIYEILERNGIEVAMWNHIVETTDNELLDSAVNKARALALGFDENTPNSVVDAEAAIVKERFTEREFNRIMEALDRLSQSPKLHDAQIIDQGVIELHEIILKSNRDIPPEGFGKFQLTFQDILDFPRTLWTKLSAWVPAAFFSSSEEQINRASEASARTWLSPLPESILSPSVQELFKKLEEKNISFECSTMRDNKGFLLNVRFFIDLEKTTDITGGHRV